MEPLARHQSALHAASTNIPDSRRFVSLRRRVFALGPPTVQPATLNFCEPAPNSITGCAANGRRPLCGGRLTALDSSGISADRAIGF